MSQPFGPAPLPWFTAAPRTRPTRPFAFPAPSPRGMTVTTSSTGSVGLAMPSSPLMSPVSEMSNASYLESPGIDRRIWELQEEAQDDMCFPQQMPANVELDQSNLGMGEPGYSTGAMGMGSNGMMEMDPNGLNSMDGIANMQTMPDFGLGMGIPMPNLADIPMDTPMLFGGEFQQQSMFDQLGPPSEPLRLLSNGLYFPSWQIYKNNPPSKLPLCLVSHIFYSSAALKEDGTVHLSDVYADVEIPLGEGKGALHAFKVAKQGNGLLKVLLSIGGPGEASEKFPAIARDPIKCERFARSAKELVVAYGLDGIDVHWETPSSLIEGQQFLSLIRVLRRHLPADPYTITAALSSSNPAHPLPDLPLSPLFSLLDAVNLLLTPPITPDAIDTSLFAPAINSLYTRGVPLHKVHLALPTPTAPASIESPNSGLPSPASSDTAPSGSPAPTSPATQAYLRSLTEAAQYARDLGLAGVVIWPGNPLPQGAVETLFGAIHELGKADPNRTAAAAEGKDGRKDVGMGKGKGNVSPKVQRRGSIRGEGRVGKPAVKGKGKS